MPSALTRDALLHVNSMGVSGSKCGGSPNVPTTHLVRAASEPHRGGGVLGGLVVSMPTMLSRNLVTITPHQTNIQRPRLQEGQLSDTSSGHHAERG